MCCVLLKTKLGFINNICVCLRGRRFSEKHRIFGYILKETLNKSNEILIKHMAFPTSLRRHFNKMYNQTITNILDVKRVTNSSTQFFQRYIKDYDYKIPCTLALDAISLTQIDVGNFHQSIGSVILTKAFKKNNSATLKRICLKKNKIKKKKAIS